MTNIRYGFPAWVAGTTSRMSKNCVLRRPAGRALLGLALATGLVLADDIDQDEVLELRQAGRVLPLERILERAGRHVRKGRLIKAELEHEDGRLVYELEYLDAGEVWELQFDAATGELLGRERD